MRDPGFFRTSNRASRIISKGRSLLGEEPDPPAFLSGIHSIIKNTSSIDPKIVNHEP